MKMFKNYKQKGSSLLLTILIMAALLTASLGISRLGLGEIKLSRNIDKTIIAFAVADAGVEAALFYERVSLGGDGGTPDNPLTQNNAILDPIDFLNESDLCLDYPNNQICFTFEIFTDAVPIPDLRVIRSIGSYGGIQRAVELTYDLN